MLFQVGNEQEALQSICKILTEHDEFRLAWIGYCEDDRDRTIRPVAKAGDSYAFERLWDSWVKTKTGEGLAGSAVRTGKPHWINDISTDPRASSWRAAAVDAGYASCIALPLIAHNQQRGTYRRPF